MLHHVQGVDCDSRLVWVSSVDTAGRAGYLREFSLADGHHLRSVTLHDGPRFHPGGFATDAHSIWIPVAEYRPKSTAVIQKRSKRTLEIEFQFSVQDHIGCLAVTPEYLIGGNWDTREFYVWDHSGKLLRKVENTTGNAYQDMKFSANQIVAGGLLADYSGAIDWLDFPSLKLTRRVAAGKTDRGLPFTREGFAVRGQELMLLPEDNESRLFVFQLQ